MQISIYDKNNFNVRSKWARQNFLCTYYDNPVIGRFDAKLSWKCKRKRNREHAKNSARLGQPFVYPESHEEFKLNIFLCERSANVAAAARRLPTSISRACALETHNGKTIPHSPIYPLFSSSLIFFIFLISSSYFLCLPFTSYFFLLFLVSSLYILFLPFVSHVFLLYLISSSRFLFLPLISYLILLIPIPFSYFFIHLSRLSNHVSCVLTNKNEIVFIFFASCLIAVSIGFPYGISAMHLPRNSIHSDYLITLVCSKISV